MGAGCGESGWALLVVMPKAETKGKRVDSGVSGSLSPSIFLSLLSSDRVNLGVGGINGGTRTHTVARVGYRNSPPCVVKRTSVDLLPSTYTAISPALSLEWRSPSARWVIAKVIRVSDC